jgi:hypothetical protein
MSLKITLLHTFSLDNEFLTLKGEPPGNASGSRFLFEVVRSGDILKVRNRGDGASLVRGNEEERQEMLENR